MSLVLNTPSHVTPLGRSRQPGRAIRLGGQPIRAAADQASRSARHRSSRASTAGRTRAPTAAGARRGTRGRAAKRVRRPRFPPTQFVILERAFRKNIHPDRLTRCDLSIELQVSETRIARWFQNRRVRWIKKGKPNLTSYAPALRSLVSHLQASRNNKELKAALTSIIRSPKKAFGIMGILFSIFTMLAWKDVGWQDIVDLMEIRNN